MQCKTPGDVLRKLRTDRGLTQQAVAEALNVNRSTYSFHETGKTQPDLQRVMASDFNALGSPMSHGCVRLAACDAKWIYYNVDSGTTVRIGDNLGAPMTGVRYQWTGGLLGPDPTYS